MRAAIVKIGNSQGVRIPKVLLEQAGIASASREGSRREAGVPAGLSCGPGAGRIVIEKARGPREGWEKAFEEADIDDTGEREIAARGGDELLLGELPNEFDKDEWTW